MTTVEALEAETGLTFLDYQRDTLLRQAPQAGPRQRLCLYYRTGAGKTYTSLAAVRLWGHTRAVVVAPPSTQGAWVAAGERFGVTVDPMSHAKFRTKDTKLARDVALVADEIHMFGGHKGQGWKKLDALAKGLQAPLIAASATPNYNDAERCYCIQHLLDPHSCKGGFIQFLYANCTTEQNPFGMEPIVTGFHRYPDAAAYLADLPLVEYLPDDLVYVINDIQVFTPLDPALDRFGYNRRKHRIVASGMEDRHTRTYQSLVNEDGFIHDHVFKIVQSMIAKAKGPLMVYADHATVAEALSYTLREEQVKHVCVTGSTPKKKKESYVAAFKDGVANVLIGTASLATGTDGLDKMCDWLLILDDTDDDSLRRQLIGRIMPRGEDVDASNKHVYRVVL